MLNPGFRDYRFPTALDMPRIKTILCGDPDEEGPFGAKEAGEGTTAPVGLSGNVWNHAIEKKGYLAFDTVGVI